MRLDRKLVAYHGSHLPLDEIERPRKLKNAGNVGIWLTSNPEAAALYGDHIHVVEVPPGNYFKADSRPRPGPLNVVQRVFFDRALLGAQARPRRGEDISDVWNRVAFDPEYLDAWRERMIANGYDGVVWKNSYIDRSTTEPPHDVYLTFSRRVEVLDRWRWGVPRPWTSDLD